MMKTRYILLSVTALLLAVTGILMTSCDRNEDDPVSSGQQQPDNTGGSTGNADGNALCIVAAKQPFADETGTRAGTDLGGTTTFETGDEIGVIAVKDGAVLDDCNNVKLTYNATGSKWEGDNPVYFKDGATYFAYSPYRAVMDGKKSTQEIYDAFIVSTSQNTAKQYAANDLMTSTTCTANKTAKTLTIAFEHRLAMLEIDRLHGFTTKDNWAYLIKNSSFSTATINGGTAIRLFKNPAEGAIAPYRCLFKPVADVPISLGYEISSQDGGYVKSGTWSASNQTFVGGQRRKIRPQKKRDIEVGDYYYSDGSIFPGNMNITPVPGKDDGCIGVVFKVGTGSGDNINYYSGSGLTGTIHGYVVALEDAVNGGPRWSYNFTECVTSANMNDYLGYRNTQTIRAMPSYSEDKDIGTNDQHWAACWYATHYSVVTPANTSGWYFPSLAQYNSIYTLLHNGQGTIFSRAGGTEFRTGLDVNYNSVRYWSSTENGSDRAAWWNFIDGSSGNMTAKNWFYRVRSCLTF